MLTSTFRNTLLAAGMVVAGLALPVHAQEDNTGTNPVNFTYDFRLYAEMASLPIDDSSLITNTFEFRWPFGRDVANLKGVGAGSPYFDMGSRLGMRLRARYSVFRASVRKNALLVDLVRQRWGVYWHENDLLLVGRLHE